jgi:tetratricopeptide (TPR) repeat protein
MKNTAHCLLLFCFLMLANIGFGLAQGRSFSPGFSIECPVFPPIGQFAKTVVDTAARVASDSLVDDARTVLMGKRDEANLKKAIALLEQAIMKDSTNETAYWGLSEIHGLLHQFLLRTCKQTYEKMAFYVQKALSLNPDLADALGLLSDVFTYATHDFACSEQLLLRALKIKPHSTYLANKYAILLAAHGDFKEAYRYRDTAVAYADSNNNTVVLETILKLRYLSHDYNGMLDYCDRINEANPNYDFVDHTLKGLALAELGKFDEALAEQKRAVPNLQKGNSYAVACLARAYLQVGDKANGKLALKQVLKRAAKGEKGNGYQIAAVYEALGDLDKTFHWLNKAVDDAEDWIIWLKQDPRWKHIRDDQRYIDLKTKAWL